MVIPALDDEVWRTAMEVYRDEEKAREFLQRKHPMLGGRKPLDAPAEKVINLLRRAAYSG
ncbi:hypothetical protein M527_15005 [Sphingobium indicum IP26]|uniref:Antitoxin Xre/MbcA/ParS-like toxin-binding domain-containing protein n=1 Tax=Sphingobium indicum F2 TaxID=1450518 RepID=A0A8E0WQZ5_9SPHN|nr:antitoxin Xre/MbcA/ParS toxin-binding domain-containing protein [Sphingobium indicum]EPR17640.1 hypothetical protein M527_15005 [Sphingobium indicum IP26]KER35338.1 hypothetical protein AL00_17330 [Sphingobium indicum F2]